MEKKERKSSDARIRANTKYLKENYKRFSVCVRKEYLPILDDYRNEHNLSANALFERAAKFCIANNINL